MAVPTEVCTRNTDLVVQPISGGHGSLEESSGKGEACGVSGRQQASEQIKILALLQLYSRRGWGWRHMSHIKLVKCTLR